MSDHRKLARSIKENLRLEALLKQIPVEQLMPIVSDLKIVGVAYESGTDYRLTARRLANKYIGRRRKFFDAIIRNDKFTELLDQFLTDYLTANQPIQDAALDTQEGVNTQLQKA